MGEKFNKLIPGARAPTRSETKLSEARSYANLAFQNQYFNLLPFPPSPAADTDMDIILEERALDSFHNILFSMTLFWDRFRTWPVHVTVVSHGFKKPRIMGHCRVIGLSEDMVTFVGIDPPGGMGDEGEAEGAMNGVKEALRDWQEDPMGRGEKLAGKRRRRNVWGVWQGVFEGGAGDDKGGLEIELDREGERLVPEGRRPWR
ncbi:hypothetical protein QQS21_006226 [Conoideocrella luteorostrata]|uniref:Uncharacterized protein n=1 Tax=Conoideocrella luteorostrata TaxID=1105319 RepID=A0AAJ0CND4_9HYPO|nr:hypothetical protein QQS21_006226 [Conoideocrella luteorostrata]